MENKLIIFSYIILGLVSSYCLAVYLPTIQKFSVQELYKNFALFTYIIFLFSSITGIVVYVMLAFVQKTEQHTSSVSANDDDDDDVGAPAQISRPLTSTDVSIVTSGALSKTEHIHHYALFMQLSIAMPCYIAYLWIKHEFIGDLMALLLPAYGLFLSIYYILAPFVADEYQNIHIACCTYSLFLIGYEKGNQYMLLCTASLAVGCWVLREYKFLGPLPPDQSYTFSMIVFLIASSKTIIK